MQSPYQKAGGAYLDLNNPNLYMTEIIYLRLRIISPYIAFTFLGVVLWFCAYAVIYFFKDFYISYAKKDDQFQRGHYYKYLEYKLIFKQVIGFAFLIIMMFIIVMFIEWRNFILSTGFLICLAFYVMFHIKYYFIDDNDFDLFDDWQWIYYRIKQNRANAKIKDE